MDVSLEIHAPGLDLHHERWNYHVLFMDEVHGEIDRLTKQAQSGYEKKGRGTIFVNTEQWMTVIRGDWDRSHITFPGEFVVPTADSVHEKFTPLQQGFEQLIREYDPDSEFVLTVEHHSAGMLSTYLIALDAGQ